MATSTTTSGPVNRVGSIFIGLGTNTQLGNVTLGGSPVQEFGLNNPAATGNRTFQYIDHALALPDPTDLHVGIDINTGDALHTTTTINRFVSCKDEPKNPTNMGNANITVGEDGLYDYHPISDSAGTVSQNYPGSVVTVTLAADYEARVGYGNVGSFAMNLGGGVTPSGGTY
jgi:hypothetical protein